MARCLLLELNETLEESKRESFLLKIFLGQSPRKSSFHPGKLGQQLNFTGRFEAIAFLEITRLVQVEQSKGLHIHGTCLRLHGCHQDYYIMLKQNCTQIR